MMITNRQRFLKIMSFEDVDRYLNQEIGPWEQTVKRWENEGLPKDVIKPIFWNTENGLMEDNYFGLDMSQMVDIKVSEPYPFQEKKIISEDDRTITYIDHRGVKRKGSKSDSGSMDQFLDFPVKDRKSYKEWKKRFEGNYMERYPDDWNNKVITWKDRDYPLWGPGFAKFGFHGMSMFWFGMENLPYLMHDDPNLIEEIYDFWTEYIITLLEKLVSEVKIDYYEYFEDMAFKTGPLVSPKDVKRFFVPRYKKINQMLRDNGVENIFVDCDGNIEELIPLFLESGINGVAPLEAAAGMDVVKLRKKYGKDLLMMGNIDKREIAKGKVAIENEVNYKTSIIKEGGYIPTIDHAIPPDISLPDFKYYLDLKGKALQSD